jgi:hypothetical protein
MASLGFRGQIYVGIPDGTPPDLTWYSIGQTSNGTITWDGEEVDTTSYDTNGWKTSMRGLRGWEISLESFYLEDNIGQNAIQDMFFNSTDDLTYMFRFVPNRKNQPIVNPTWEEMIYFEGLGYSMGSELNPALDGAIVISTTIKGTDELNKVVPEESEA